jgi:hypothetical protein
MHIAYWIALILLAVLWGQFERRQRRFRRGLIHPALRSQGTFRFLAIGQGIVSLLLFGLFVVAFFLFTWKIALLAILVGFAVAAISH